MYNNETHEKALAQLTAGARSELLLGDSATGINLVMAPLTLPQSDALAKFLDGLEEECSEHPENALAYGDLAALLMESGKIREFIGIVGRVGGPEGRYNPGERKQILDAYDKSRDGLVAEDLAGLVAGFFGSNPTWIKRYLLRASALIFRMERGPVGKTNAPTAG